MTVALLAGLTVTGACGTFTAALTRRGLQQLREIDQRSSRVLPIGAVLGGLTSGAAVSAAHRTDEWEVLPAVLLWGCLLVAAGLCDAATQRIPTVLVRAGTAAVTVLFTVGFAVGQQWRSLALAAVAAAAAALTLLVCWRLLGAGRGDVRLALLGGLGLGGAHGRGVVIGLLVFATILAGQVVQQRSTGRRRETSIPLGPALAAGFICAAAQSALA